MKNNLLALCGAAVGGAIGYFGYAWLLSQGYYAIALPGGLLGLGAAAVKNHSIFVAVICGIAAIALGIFSEFQSFPFAADTSLRFFISHLNDLTGVTKVMIVLGGVIGFYLPFQSRLAAPV